MQVTCRKSVKTQGTAAAKPPSGGGRAGLIREQHGCPVGLEDPWQVGAGHQVRHTA
jgi:hypothetical protein